MWAENSVFYQIYPLGLCGAPQENDGTAVPRIRRLLDWTGHIKSVGADAVYFCPIFQSDAHGYDTRDYRTLDCRLGENKDFREVCDAFHAAGLRVVLDGVFNHVGRGFWAFQDLLQNRESSAYRDWFFVNFGGDSPYRDGLWYEGWEGHYELVKLNLRNPAVVDYLLDTVRFWTEAFDIDGLRLDVAYLLDRDFIRRLRGFCEGLKPDFFLVGEMLGGDYNQLLGEGMLHSVTNYECYKGLYSSLNSMNLFEIAHSLGRQFGPENWTLYKGKHLLAFADNHDVTRAASILQNPAHLPLLYALLFAMPGIPCVYYGSEWGITGEKSQGDGALRPAVEQPQKNKLTDWIAGLAAAHKENAPLWSGDYKSLLITNKQLVFQRQTGDEIVLAAVNADGTPFTAHFPAPFAEGQDLLSGQKLALSSGLELAPYSAYYITRA
ncbi:MAG: maltodextrin glucosidase [Clostridiales bacterium]|nr:maltodextrin glucosidase [Clostridiales bacterium]